MGASFGAELLKLRKRPGTWLLGSLYLLLALLFGYVIPYGIYLTLRGGAGGDTDFGVPPEQILADALPRELVTNVLGGFPLFGGAIALILGALAVGSEFGWGTLKTIFTQRPPRLAVFAGKLLALGVVLGILTLVIFVAGAAASALVASVEGEPITWPSAGVVLKGTGSAWLILAMWCSFGMMLATLFRGTAFAIGIGLVWAFIIESLIGGFAGLLDVLGTIQKALPGPNAGSLVASFGSATQGENGAPGVVSAVSGNQATGVLVAYIAAFLAIAALLLRRRDVT